MDFSIIKRHPVATGGAIVVGGLALYMLVARGGGSDAGAVGSGFDPVQAQFALQEDAIQADVMKANIAAQYNLEALKQQGSNSLDLAKENNSASVAATNVAAQVSMYQIGEQSKISTQQIAASLQENANATGVQMAMVNNSLQQAMASIAAQTHIVDVMSSQQTQLMQIQSTTQLGLADISASVERLRIKKAAEQAIWQGAFQTVQMGMMAI